MGSRDLHLQSSIMVWGGLESSSELTSKYDDNDDFLATFTIANEAANSLPPLVHMTWQIVAALMLLGCCGHVYNRTAAAFEKSQKRLWGVKKRGPNDLCWLPEKRGLRSIALATISSSSCCNSERTKKKKEEEGLTKETYTYQICMIEQSRKDLLIISQGQGIGNFYGLRRKPITTRALSLSAAATAVHSIPK